MLVGGYSSSEEDDEGGGSASKGAGPAPTVGPAPAPAPEGGPAKRKRVDYTKLPVSRPLQLEAASDEPEVDAPLKGAAALEAMRLTAGRSLLASLPAPRATLGSETAMGGGGSKLDLTGVGRKRGKPAEPSPDEVARLLRPTDDFSTVPDGLHAHPLFKDGGAAANGDGPSQDDLQQMRTTKAVGVIRAQDMMDPDWSMNNLIHGGPGLHKGKHVAEEVSMYETETWKKTTLANPNRTQKRKHQINWLAQEAIDTEAEMLDRQSQGRMSKGQTSAKYGW